MRGRVLIAGASDSCGAAGIQADIKTITALGGYAATAITAIAATNTKEMLAVVGMAPDFVRQQMRLALDDIGADAIKTGMLHKTETINAVAAEIEAHGRGVPLVVAPALTGRNGARLLEIEAIAALKRRLICLATIITPSLAEAEALAGLAIPDLETMKHAAEIMLTLGCGAVLLTGGITTGEEMYDIFATEDGLEVLTSRRIDVVSPEGTGPTIASAIAAGLAQGMELEPAVRRARAFVRRAIETAPGYGTGHGPLNHTHSVAPFTEAL